MKQNKQRDSPPRINGEYLSSRRSTSRENYNDPLRELVIRYCASWEDVVKLIGKTEKETRTNIENYKKIHTILIKQEIDNSETKGRYNAKYGYMRVGIDNRLVENEGEQVVIRSIMTLRYSFDLTYAEIAKYLNDSGIKSRTGKDWQISVISRIVNRKNNIKGEE